MKVKVTRLMRDEPSTKYARLNPIEAGAKRVNVLSTVAGLFIGFLVMFTMIFAVIMGIVWLT